MANTKPYLTYPQQVARLIDRGLQVVDHDAAIAVLRAVGYYNFSGYLYPYRLPGAAGQGRSSLVRPGTRFEQIVDLLTFDLRLRVTLLLGIQQIEIAMRSQVAHVLGRHDPFGHTHPASLDLTAVNRLRTRHGVTDTAFGWFQAEYDRLEQRASTEPYVAHNLSKYGPPLPIWIACEFLDFGAVVNLYQLLVYADRQAIAADAGLGKERTLRSWLTTLNYVRNICAHNARLWNRRLVQRCTLRDTDLPADLATLTNSPGDKLYPVIAITAFLTNSLNPTGKWASTMAYLLDNFPSGSARSIREMGAPANWATQPIWNNQDDPKRTLGSDIQVRAG